MTPQNHWKLELTVAALTALTLTVFFGSNRWFWLGSVCALSAVFWATFGRKQ